MFFYKGRIVPLLGHYIYDPIYEEWRREIDVMIASILELELKFEYDQASNYVKVSYLKNGQYLELPYYCSDLNSALALFAGERDIILTFKNIFGPSDEFDRPHGEWWVKYDDREKKIIYLPGSGSYFRPAEAVVRAWLNHKNIWLINKYPIYEDEIA